MSNAWDFTTPIWYEWSSTYPKFTEEGGGSSSSVSSSSSSSSCLPVPDAAFDTYPVAGPIPLSIEFFDRSLYSPTSWYWQFGDGSTSTLQNPVHIYTEVGKYTITLTATNYAGSDSITRYDYINALPYMGPEPSGIVYDEYYLYSEKGWEMAPSGVSFYNLQHAVHQNAPIVVTPSGYEVTSPEQPWAKTSGQEKYRKVGFGYFNLLPNGQYDPDAREFSLQPDASGKLVFNGLLREDVFIEYEAGASGYYIMDSIDYNPVRSEVTGGFVHFSQTSEPASLYLSASQNSVRADGFQGYQLTAILYDADFDRVPSANIVFEIENMLPATSTTGFYSELGYLNPNTGTVRYIDASGQAAEILEVTSPRGEAHVNYITNNGKTGVSQVKAYYLEASGIYDRASAGQYYLSIQPFTLDFSLLDTLDYLT